jgi:hypothetical protein
MTNRCGLSGVAVLVGHQVLPRYSGTSSTSSEEAKDLFDIRYKETSDPDHVSLDVTSKTNSVSHDDFASYAAALCVYLACGHCLLPHTGYPTDHCAHA